MRGSGEHTVDRREALCNEHRDLRHGIRRNGYGKVKAAGHQADAFHLGKGLYACGKLIKAGVLLRRNAQFNECTCAVHICTLPVDERAVALDDAVFFKLMNGGRHFGFGHIQHNGKLLHGQLGIILQEL